MRIDPTTGKPDVSGCRSRRTARTKPYMLWYRLKTAMQSISSCFFFAFSISGEKTTPTISEIEPFDVFERGNDLLNVLILHKQSDASVVQQIIRVCSYLSSGIKGVVHLKLHISRANG
jgi:hypothetical protein